MNMCRHTIVSVFWKESKDTVHNGSFRERDWNTGNTGDLTFLFSIFLQFEFSDHATHIFLLKPQKVFFFSGKIMGYLKEFFFAVLASKRINNCYKNFK